MPRLWNDVFNGLKQFETTNISNLPTHEHIERGNKRLGKLAEDLFCFWLKDQTDYKVVFKNIQIIHKKRTLGELDICLFSLNKKKHIHLELITKFYLYNPNYNPNSIDAWIGPNRNDSLKNKIEKLNTKQLPLIHNTVTKLQLQQYNINFNKILQQVCFKAWLFIPLNFKGKLTLLNPECIAGNYMDFSTFKKTHSTHKKYFCPTKQDWLHIPNNKEKWASLFTVAKQIKLFMDSKQAIMVWVKDNTKFTRIIIVPYNEF